ncbi:nuclear transport factor 2 family protein [Tardiphaga sp. 604_B6_N1_1]|uniref:nuclear transport factor 2 family protein n=1 Tax=unclassified Tardiphaga TaxID=2631404 RepID=UPI003F20E58B
MMDLPDAAKAFFDADERSDPHAVVAAFSHNGSVMDEGVRHQGGDAIRKWWSAAKDKYHHVAVPFEVAHVDNKTRVRATVTGYFPGSPAALNYTFTIIGGKIAGLEIG